MRFIITTATAILLTSSAFAATTANAGFLPNVNVDAIVDSVLGKDPPQGNCYDGYHVKTIRSYNAKGKFIGKSVTCEEDD